MNDMSPTRDPSYEKSKSIASDGDRPAKRELAGRDDARPEILYFLAEDRDADVREAAAANPATPPHADLILARDAEAEVRAGLAGKLARLVPGLSHEGLHRLHKLTHEAIGVLARDELPRIRSLVAEALRDLAGDVPDEIAEAIRRLAADEVLEIAGPLLERSTVLADDDLLEIIAGPHADGALACVARRQDLSAALADAIVDDGEVEAIAALLANDSAQIREDTLDRIIDGAEPEESWHDPLVRRPSLSPGGMVKIAGFVARSLLEVLRSRADLDAETAAELEEVVARRLEEPGADDEAGENAGEDEDEETPIEKARRLQLEGELTADLVMDAVAAGQRMDAIAGIAVMAGASYDGVRDLIASRSPKAVTSLAWKAGFDMRQAIQVQLRLAGISPQSALYAKNGEEYPLTEDDMEWQLEFVGLAVKPRK